MSGDDPPTTPKRRPPKKKCDKRSAENLWYHYIDLKKAVFAYAVVVATSFFVSYACFRIRAISSIVLGLIIGKIILDVIFMPMRLDFWSEYDTFVALYALIQLLTPILIMVYAIWCAVKDRRGPKHLDHAPNVHEVLVRRL